MGTLAQRRHQNREDSQPFHKVDQRIDYTEPAFRTPTTFKPFSAAVASVGTPVVVWTPATGTRFRLMGWAYSVSSYATGAAAIFKEASVAAGVGTIWANPTAASDVPVYNPPGFANGIFAASRNNPLAIDSDTAGVTYEGTVYGTEEAGD